MFKKNPQQEAATKRLEATGTGSGARRQRFAFEVGRTVRVDAKGRGILVRTLQRLPETNNMRPPTGNRERARNAR